VARFAAAASSATAARNAILELGGPDWLSQHDVLRLCEEIGGRPFAVEYVPEEALRQQLECAKDQYEQAFAGLMLVMARGGHQPMDTQPALQAIPLRMVSVRDYIRRMLAVPAAI
jgi:uncharacterized protein YbjT (DUF2867 family)